MRTPEMRAYIVFRQIAKPFIVKATSKYAAKKLGKVLAEGDYLACRTASLQEVNVYSTAEKENSNGKN